MRLSVLSVAYPFAPVGRDAVGGAEQVLTTMDEALVRRGHRSVVIAAEGSRAAGTLVATPRFDGELDDATRRTAWVWHRGAIDRVLREERVDVVHMHGVDFHAYLPPVGPPVLVTLHLPLSWYPREALRPARRGVHLHCVSASQRAACPPGVALSEDVPNGVSLDALRPAEPKRNFAMALGRICPEKGFHVALDAAALARVPLVLAGQVYRYEAHERYFREQIVPRLGASRRFIGQVDLERKRELLAAARCLLVPSLVAETSSLVAMEALACGTPVVAFAGGALTEIVEHGRTGFIVRDAREMAEAIHAAAFLRPSECRRAAEERFSSDSMVRRYLSLYEQIAHDSRRDRLDEAEASTA
jgi:glycosyltransferase involved in cell wall biosynthesis